MVKTKKRLNGRDVPGRHRLAVPSPGRDPRTHRTCVAALLLVSSIDVTDLSMSCTVCPCNEGPDLRSVRFVRSLAVTPVPGAVVLLYGLEPDSGPLLTVPRADLASGRPLKVVAVKKLEVGSLVRTFGSDPSWPVFAWCSSVSGSRCRLVYFEKIRVFKAGASLE